MTPLLEVRNIAQLYDVRGKGLFAATRKLQAVDGVDLVIEKGAAVGLVGESGCGKSTLAKVAAGFIRPTEGEVLVNGEPLLGSSTDKARRSKLQMVFQNPLAALDPRMMVGKQIDEALALAGVPRDRRAVERNTLLGQVGLNVELAERFPHQISGGQRQRIVIARALAAKPELLICDEPLAALDVSVQAQVLTLLAELRRSLGLSFLFISHQLSTVRFLCDEVAVMYAGRIVEQGPTEEIFSAPRHPYTQMLMSTTLDPRHRRQERSIKVAGEPPDPLDLPSGCPFNPRCPLASDICREVRPSLVEHGKAKVACHVIREASAVAA